MDVQSIGEKQPATNNIKQRNQLEYIGIIGVG